MAAPQQRAGGTRSPAPAAAAPEAQDAVAHALAEGTEALVRGDRRRARPAFERALALAETAGDRAAQARALAGLGDSHDPLRENALVLGYYERAVELAEGPDLDLLRARVLYATGAGLHGQDRFAEAQAQFEQALALARAAGDSSLVRRCHMAVGNAALVQNLWDLAEEHYQAALDSYGPSSASPGALIAIRGLGDVAVSRGEPHRAVPFYERAVALARQLEDANLFASALLALGSLYLDWADYPRAHALFLQALEAQPSNRDMLGYLLNNLGIVTGLQGMGDISVDYFRRARTIGEELGDRHLLARVTNNLGVLLLKAGDHAGAAEAFQRALDLAQEAGDRVAVVGDWRNLGTVYEEEGRLDEAEAAYRRGLEAAREGGFKVEIGQSLAALAGLALARGEATTALGVANEGAVLAVEVGARELFWLCRTLAGRALAALGRNQEAREAFGEAILTVEAVRKSLHGGIDTKSFLSTRLDPYRSLVALEVSAGNALAALEAAEAARARMLLDNLSQNRAGDAGPTLNEEARGRLLADELVRRNQELFQARQRAGADPAALTALKADVTSARIALRSFQADLAVRHPSQVIPEAPAEITTSLLTALDRDSATLLLVFAVLDERTVLFTLAASEAEEDLTVEVHSINERKESLRHRVEDLHDRLARRDLGFEGAAREVYDLLLAPIEEQLHGRRRLVIVPDGPLWNLPFQALKDAGGSYLLDRFVVSYAPSLAVLHEMPSGAGPPAGAVLAIGNPVLAPDSPVEPASATRRSRPLAPLPEAEDEVRELSRLHGPRRGQILIGAEATESRVKAAASGFSVLHFATHGVLEDSSPLYSHLVLAQEAADTGEDGLLEAWEVLSLRLRAELVVLSACHTAQGVVGEGEGLIGLVWSFLAAGSRAVVASQWEVDSAAAAALMVELHRRLAAGEPKAQALQGAARHLAAQPAYRHPFYWAGFVLVGDGAGSLAP